MIGQVVNDSVLVREIHAVSNVWEGDKTNRFMLDPRTHIRLQREARERGLSIVGFYHSHPTGSPQPSAFDAEMAWPEQSYLIVALEGDEPRLKSWRFDENEKRFAEELLEITP